ncbi:MAG TPA: YIP1 family protein [Longimicrobium sp.]|jgi:hypothetical protein
MARSLTERMIGAAMLDVSVYEEVEADTTATGQAALVVAIVAICSAIGAAGNGGKGIIGAVISAFIGWVIWAALTYAIGTGLFRGTATIGELLRTLGFAMSPGVLYILGFIPILGPLVAIVVKIWMLVTGVVAIRQALDIDTGKAVLTALISWLVMIVVGIIIAMIVAGVALTGAAIGAAFGL